MIQEILQYEFLQNAFLTGIIIGLLPRLLGVFIVVRRLSLIADALSHVTLAGIAASLLLRKKVFTGGYVKSALYGDVFFGHWLIIY